MTVALQIRDVPEDVRDIIAQRAASLGQSMQAYLLDVLRREARFARNAAVFESTAAHRRALPAALSPERIIREGRDDGVQADRGPVAG
ncbi:FitA-like ribbon-helix-helix domain-containing protein [Jiangella rhizosphaerae]|uniref:Antitoxin FitA-like ribbon-helix-helix domain-containing protein n=1 Tax=Jiangella rhizosphaerae TaxID=2293569 RepID=A0A418KMI7_9ACTN|nr:hypothetical protein [Jiangella rhizosphaerae]RIQ19579.1 hypothetical protein DY240_19370 [Jiangella rhizosphaerae]